MKAEGSGSVRLGLSVAVSDYMDVMGREAEVAGKAKR